jgi:hypothetical protein
VGWAAGSRPLAAESGEFLVKQYGRLLAALAVLVVGISDVSAQNKCNSVSGVSGVTPCLLSGTDVIAVTCPSGGTCGSAANSSALNLTPFNGTTGWHSYSSGSAATYLNNLSTSIGAGVTFALSGTSSLRIGNGTTNNLPWRNPTNDNGYYLAASSCSPNCTPTITLTFDDSTCSNSNCIAQFSLYWGSLDSWNTITFTPTSGSAISLSGSQIATALNLPTPGQNDTASYVLNFEVPTNDALWTTVTLSSSYPAFEFDNIAWESVIGTTNGAPVPIPSGTTPEPAGLLLFATGIASVAGRVRRKIWPRN